MQAIVSLPTTDELTSAGGPRVALRRWVCGTPLLPRILETAARSGVTKALLIRPASLPEETLQRALRTRLLKTLEIEIVEHDGAFDPENAGHWKGLEPRLDAKFLWLPWNAVIDKRRLVRLTGLAAEAAGVRFKWETADGDGAAATEIPLLISRKELLGAAEGSLRRFAAQPAVKTVDLPGPLSAPVTNRRLAHAAEDDLLRWSGKDWDGYYSKFNRRLCWPFLRALWRTQISPNIVTFAGLIVVIFSGYFYAQGNWLAYVAGGLLYFIAVLFDEIDGMLARLTFRDSAFGCWLETWVDYASYVLVYGGITIGLYRQSGKEWLVLGVLMFVGMLVTILVASNQRKLATEPGKPHEYQMIIHQKLEENSGDFLPRNTRQLQFILKKAVMAHHLLVFSVLGLLKLHFVLSVVGCNMVWVLALPNSNELTDAVSPGESSRRP